jgi:hypothetical protein
MRPKYGELQLGIVNFLLTKLRLSSLSGLTLAAPAVTPLWWALTNHCNDHYDNSDDGYDDSTTFSFPRCDPHGAVFTIYYLRELVIEHGLVLCDPSSSFHVSR